MASRVVQQVKISDFYAGTHHILAFSIYDFDIDPTGNTLRNISDDVLKFAVSRSSGSQYQATPLFQKSSVTGGITKTDPMNGQCEVEIVRVDTQNLLGDVHLELEDFDENGESVMVAVGDFSILRNVKNT